MSITTSIEWTDATWNPIIGCTKISAGCKNCYAKTLSERFRGVPGHPFERGFDLRLVPEKLHEPLKWKSGKKIFTCSMSDVFHEKVSIDYIKSIFEVMNEAHWHTFQVLTKRSQRLVELSHLLTWTPNIWIGVSIESQAQISRSKDLSLVPASVRFISAEPLISSIPNLPLSGINWVIVGGESGLGARPMNIEWVKEIKSQCQRDKVAFFLKQLGGKQNKRGGDQAILDGKRWLEFPGQKKRLANA